MVCDDRACYLSCRKQKIKRIDRVLHGLWTPGTRVRSFTELTEVPGSRYAYRTVVPVQLELIVARVYRT